MTSSPGPAFSEAPKFNHVAVSVPADALDDDGRAAICGFYGDVFGFEEYPELTKPGGQLVLRAHSHEQFVFIISDGSPMAAPRMDHWGMSVATKDDFDEVARRAAKWKADNPDDIDLVDPSFEEFHGVLRLHSFYVKHALLPMMLETQHFEWLVDV